MSVSMVDAGTIEMLREFRKMIVSSADLVSRFEAVLTEAQVRTHYEAQVLIDEILAEGFREVARHLRPPGGGAALRLTEYDLVPACSTRRCDGTDWSGRTDPTFP